MQGRERAGDLYAALAWARAQPWADKERIIAAGWSHGSWTIMDALALRSGAEMRRATGITDLPDEPLEGLAATFLVYPYTGVGSLAGRRWRVTPRSVAIACGRDFIVGDSRGVLQRQRNHGAPIEIHFFPGATHAFDEADANDPRVRYDPLVTRQAGDAAGRSDWEFALERTAGALAGNSAAGEGAGSPCHRSALASAFTSAAAIITFAKVHGPCASSSAKAVRGVCAMAPSEETQSRVAEAAHSALASACGAPIAAAAADASKRWSSYKSSAARRSTSRSQC
ncbi:MAG: hypothetical protein WDM79_06695 [Terricaulis sp.]